jgi:threonine/homoserine/homoserine lactone efflux protein
VLGLIAIAAIAVVLFEEAYETEEATKTTGHVIKIVIGTVLILYGLKKGIGKVRATGTKEPPGWIAALSDASDARAFGIAVLNAVNPKVVVLTAAAVNGIVQTGIDGAGLVAATLVFLVIASSTVVVALLLYLFGGAPARVFLERTRAFMLTNTDVIVAVVMLLLGASVLGDGLSGWGNQM